MVIFDTNILIELYRGNTQIKDVVLHLDADVFYISTITVVEFLAGARNKQELRTINKQLGNYTCLLINTDINDIFLELFKKYNLSHKPSIPDTLIAATALYYDLPLLTLNKKDFQYIPDLKLL